MYTPGATRSASATASFAVAFPARVRTLLGCGGHSYRSTKRLYIWWVECVTVSEVRMGRSFPGTFEREWTAR